MSHRYVRVALFGLFAVCITMKSEMGEPVGPKLCDRLCKHRVGCSSFKYSPSDLSCNLTGVKDGKYKHTARKDTDRMYADKNLTCQEGTVIFHNRANKIICRPLYAAKERQRKTTAKKCQTQTDELQYRDNCPQQRKNVKKKRLLMLPYIPNGPGSGNCQGRQLFLHNNSVVPYRHIRNKSPTALTYVSTVRKLLIATGKPWRLFSAGLDQDDTNNIIGGMDIVSIATDEGTLDMFFVLEAPWAFGRKRGIRRKICVMKIEGKHLRIFVELTGPCTSPVIAADPRRSVIYVVCKGRYIRMYTYKGKDRWVMVKGYMRPSLHFDLKTDVLYYMTGSSSVAIHSLSLWNGSARKMKELTVRGNTLYVIDNIIYVLDVNMKWTVVPEKGDVMRIESGFDPRHVKHVVSCVIT